MVGTLIIMLCMFKFLICQEDEILDVSVYSENCVDFFSEIDWNCHVSASVAESATRALLPVGQDPPRPLGGQPVPASNGIQPGKNLWQQLLPRIFSLLQCCNYLLISPYPAPVIFLPVTSAFYLDVSIFTNGVVVNSLIHRNIYSYEATDLTSVVPRRL